jgi:hypothetical protein
MTHAIYHRGYVQLIKLLKINDSHYL